MPIVAEWWDMCRGCLIQGVGNREEQQGSLPISSVLV